MGAWRMVAGMASANVIAPPMVEPPTEFLSAEEFLDWLEPHIHADLIAGEIIMHSPVSLRHADVLNFIDRLLAAYIEEKRLGKLYRENLAVRLNQRNVFMPDLCFFTNDQAARLAPNHAPFAPALAVEVLSPSSVIRDERHKFAAYEAHGVQEYWIIDPERFLHRFYRREGEVFKPFNGVAEDAAASAVVPGFFLRRSWLNILPLPEVKGCLAEILRG
jgi:Uma2 family endonuclease